jgi:hypothetical protein
MLKEAISDEIKGLFVLEKRIFEEKWVIFHCLDKKNIFL